MKRHFGFFAAAMILLSIPPAHGNDSMARVGAGGITLLKSERIRLLEEVLLVSTGRISVKYRFLNESDKDIGTTVAFPMPPYRRASDHVMWDQNQKAVETFEALVDGRPVKTRTITRALVGRTDVTGRLRRAGLSDKQIRTFAGARISKDGTRLIDNLTGRQRKAIARLGGDEKSGPPWTVASTIVWKQTFPARGEVVVDHTYTPFAGITYSAPYQKKYGRVGPAYPAAGDAAQATDEACLDGATKKSIDDRLDALAAGGAEMAYVTLHDVEYVLGTGRNWKGPIGSFTLRIEKDGPDQIVSLCFPGERREVSPTMDEFVEKDFVPQDRLVVYFYDVGTEPAYRIPKGGAGKR